MKYLLVLAATSSLVAPAEAQTIEELQAELEAQKQIIELQRQRIETLEAELAGREIAPPFREKGSPTIAQDDPEQDRALERALQRRGASVLPANVIEVAPSISWTHSGRDILSNTDNIIAGSLDARVGLSSGWMIGANLNIISRDIEGLGDNTGLGDLSVTVWKSLLNESDARPSIVASLRYSAPTGDDFGEDNVPLGSGFHRVTGRLAAVKTFDPIAFYGDVSYTEHISESIAGLDVQRSGIFGIGAGANLAVTPDISASVGLDFGFEDAPRVDGVAFGGDRTIGTVELGLGVLLNRSTFLNVAGAIGITDDSPDVAIGISLPIRF